MFPCTYVLSYYYTLISLLFELNVKISCCGESWRVWTQTTHVCRTLITLRFSSFETLLLKAVSVLQRGTCVIHLCLEFLWIVGVSLLEESDHAVVDLWSSGPGRSCIWRSGDPVVGTQTAGRRAAVQTETLESAGEINSSWASMSCVCCFIHQTRPSLTHSYSLHSFFSVCLLHRSLFISSLMSSSCIYGSRCSEAK